MMDAVEFIKERDRMCRFYHHAGDCYQFFLLECECSELEGMVGDDNIVIIVEEWSAAHPIKTRQSVFLEQYPETRIGDDGVLQINPCSISASHRNARGNCATMRRECTDCRREFWMQEEEE